MLCEFEFEFSVWVCVGVCVCVCGFVCASFRITNEASDVSVTQPGWEIPAFPSKENRKARRKDDCASKRR